ncbi:MAG: 5-dehydro-4-deoxy-D-glucuronate isomerase [Alphaproteobacteria bacterium]|nr:5-dehydro-4-deoxy-D-glucuronate isomerase [Rhizobiaceae bacterium]MBU3962145.1 5-dehydro-4-deoxy-D-glucuronate isomerase [Alphaproteobacteria bacterium]MBU4048487.1 5-dehydro-4-deoxy-D-glucuronate isomerase [Alphaproteobacteria bacterium]MBU4090352.1 5-dehydro-4-deoxy-D-glucuronate isomerase [Alphaproteobacteria bacterium]MBU4159144.1 5-dehydro-4-deoxy-D-glucuronate isomerase [Alphaproteobacteria bacterium]
MTTEFTSRFAIDPAAAAAMGTDELRHNFHLANLFEPGKISLTYTHYDRMVVGGAVPLGQPLALEAIKPVGTQSFLERRELVAVNIGGEGTVVVSGEAHRLNTRDMLYVGLGEEVSFTSADAGKPAKFYLLSAPAHRECPTRPITLDKAKRLDLGRPETSNERSIFQFTTTIETCQLVVGMTQLAKGSVWNTMPAHVHDRRMEAYLYFDLAETARVFHFMGEPSETRHILIANEEAVLSPAWSIHSGCGTANYAFIWAMAGDNVDYTDVDPVTMGELR